MKKNSIGFDRILKKLSYVACILRLVPVAVAIAIARLMSHIVEKAIDGEINEVLFAGGILIAVVIGVKIFEIITGILYQKASSKALHKCKLLLYDAFLSNPFSVVYNEKHGESKEKFNDDFDTVTARSLEMRPRVFVGIVTVVVYMAVLAFKSPLVATVLMLISLLQIIPPLIVKRFLQANYDNCREIEGKITDFTISGYRGFAMIKLYGLKEWWLDKLLEYHRLYAKIGNASTYANQTEQAIGKLLDNILKYGVYGIIGIFIMFEYTSLTVGVCALTLSSGMFSAVKDVFLVIPKLGVAKVAEKRISEWFVVCNNGSLEIHDSKIALSNVTYAYDDKIILDNTSVVFDCDKINIIKGSNGIGKSTLFRIITGMLIPVNGEVKILGLLANNLSDSEFPKKIFYLPQEDALFSNFTARKLFELLIPEKISDVLRIADRFLLSNEALNYTKINELSGGERKKVFLALAFACTPLVMLLDEPTNALDEASKLTLKELLKERQGGALIITHDSIFDDIVERTYLFERGVISLEEC